MLSPLVNREFEMLTASSLGRECLCNTNCLPALDSKVGDQKLIADFNDLLSWLG